MFIRKKQNNLFSILINDDVSMMHFLTTILIAYNYIEWRLNISSIDHNELEFPFALMYIDYSFKLYKKF